MGGNSGSLADALPLSAICPSGFQHWGLPGSYRYQ
jgi:hypothetical protein